jgi:hypothetical protein
MLRAIQTSLQDVISTAIPSFFISFLLEVSPLDVIIISHREGFVNTFLKIFYFFLSSLNQGERKEFPEGLRL